MSFKDHFSGHAAEYAAHRPDYPPALFEYLAQITPRHDRAWDCGTGSGQAALALTPYFDEVIATDASAAQLTHATPHPRITYRVAPADRSGFDDSSVDLVTVAQALHWFPIAAFWVEVQRVVRPRGIVAVWTYALQQINAAIDPIMGHFYREIIGPYWPPERRHVEEGYANIPFPFTKLESPSFAMRQEWNFVEFIDYVRTWSAVQRYSQANGHDPVDQLARELEAAWGPPAQMREITWPLSVRAGVVGERTA